MPFRSEQPELHRYQALMLVQRGRPADRPLATGELSDARAGYERLGMSRYGELPIGSAG